MSLVHQMLLDAPRNLLPLTEAAGSTSFKDVGSTPTNATIAATPTLASATVVPGAAKVPQWQARTTTSDDDGLSLGTAWDLPAAAWTVEWCFTIQGLALPNAQGGTFLAKDSNPTRGWVIRRGSGGTEFHLERSAGFFWNLTGLTALVVGRQYHAVLTWSGTAYTLHYNNVLQGTLVSSTNLTPSPGAIPTEIGRRNYGGTFYDSHDGGLGYLAVYTTALSDARRTAHYEAFLRSGVTY